MEQPSQDARPEQEQQGGDGRRLPQGRRGEPLGHAPVVGVQPPGVNRGGSGPGGEAPFGIGRGGGLRGGLGGGVEPTVKFFFFFREGGRKKTNQISETASRRREEKELVVALLSFSFLQLLAHFSLSLSFSAAAAAAEAAERAARTSGSLSFEGGMADAAVVGKGRRRDGIVVGRCPILLLPMLLLAATSRGREGTESMACMRAGVADIAAAAKNIAGDRRR